MSFVHVNNYLSVLKAELCNFIYLPIINIQLYFRYHHLRVISCLSNVSGCLLPHAIQTSSPVSATYLHCYTSCMLACIASSSKTRHICYVCCRLPVMDICSTRFVLKLYDIERNYTILGSSIVIQRGLKLVYNSCKVL